MREEHSRGVSRYQGADGKAYHAGKRGIPPVAYDWVARSRARKLAEYVTSEDVVFEVGVGTGWNLARLPCRRRLGLDVGEFLAEEVKSRGIEFIADEGAIATSSCDVVLLHHVLEHVPNPLGTLQSAHRWLRPGGRLLIFVPYEKERRYRSFRPDEPNHHLFSWNLQTLGNLITEAGFQWQSGAVTRFGYDRFSSVWAVKLGLGEGGYRAIRRLAQFIFRCQEVRAVATRP